MMRLAWALAIVVPLLLSTRTPLRAAPERAAVVAGNSEFAFALYRELSASDGNLFVSPFSVSTALAMTYAGAAGVTASQMAETLRFPFPPGELAEAFGGLQGRINSRREIDGIEMAVANSLWPQRGFELRDGFIELVRASFAGELRELDYASDAAGAAGVINGWVADRTNGRIRNIATPGALTPMTRLVLVNAIYFNGDWSHQFDPENTRPEEFAADGGQPVDVPMMNLTAELPYAAVDGARLVDLPYAGGALSMTVLLPPADGDLSALEERLDARRIDDWMAALEQREVELALPKFTLESSFELGGTLAAMGMPDAFTPGRADFSGMVADQRPFFIGAILHKAFVEVAEEGTEAAAATAVVMRTTAIREPLPPVVLRVDRPFLFLIRDRASGSILFLGRVTNPLD